MKKIRLTAAIAATAILALTSCSGSNQQQDQAYAPEVEVITAGLGHAERELSFPATVKGKTDIDIRPQVTGLITKVHVDEGQKVSKGQVLFSIDPVQYQAAVDQAYANLTSAQTNVNKAKMTLENKKRLYSKNIISEYEMQLAESDYKAAQAALENAQASLVSAQKNLAYTSVTSPSDGVVGRIPMREGSLASPSNMEPLTTVSDISQAYVYFSLTEKDLLEITKNGKMTVNESLNYAPPVGLRLADGSVYPLKGKVSTVSGVIDNNTGAASVRAVFDNPYGILRSGSSGNVIIPDERDSVIVIPQVATFDLQDLKMVYVLNDSCIAKSRRVEVVPLTDGKNCVVIKGLTPGERVVVEGVNVVVREGVQVQPKEGKQAEAQPAETKE